MPLDIPPPTLRAIRMRPLSIPIGIDDFRKVRELGLEYVDKSALIQEVVDRPGTEVFLVPRPCFGSRWPSTARSYG